MLKAASFTTKDIHPLTDFLRNSKSHIKHLRDTGQPEILTVNGRAVAVLQDPQAYDQLLARVERAELIESLRIALKQVEDGRTISLEELEAKLDEL